MTSLELRERPPQVLVVEDEPDLRDAMVSYLNRKGVVADGVGSCAAYHAWMATHACDVIVLDLGLPDGDGLDIARAVRQGGRCGLVIATARGHIDERLAGYESGADAYLVKPVDLRELLLVVGNLTKHLRERPGTRAWRLDTITWTLMAPTGRTVRLTRSECMLMQQVAHTPGEVVPRPVLAAALGYHLDTYDKRSMDTLVRRLRRKADNAFGEPLPLETVHALGLAFRARIQLEQGSIGPV